eukprot:616830-Prymnesium_polylepis.1
MSVAPVVPQRRRARRTVSPLPRAPPTPNTPRRRPRCPYLRMPRGLSSPRVLRPDPVTTPGCPVLGECVRGGRGGRTALALHSPYVLSPDPVTTPGFPVLGGCVRGGRRTALPRRVA